VICNDEDTDGRARVTTDEERVLPEDFIIRKLPESCKLLTLTNITNCYNTIR